MKEDVWIIGAGRFGKLAYVRLRDREKFRFTIVDPSIGSLQETGVPGSTLVQADGVLWLSENLSREGGPRWIIPALPLHLAAQWIYALSARELRQAEVPPGVDPLVPNPLRGVSLDLYVSHATFICPDNCPEPEKLCTHTGKPRKPNMYDILSEISIENFETVVLRSHQLGPGIGGYRPEQLYRALECADGSDKNLLICTACRCHGVITALVTPESQPADFMKFPNRP